MPIQLNTAPIRAQLHSDLAAAYGMVFTDDTVTTNAIYDSDPKVPRSGANLPLWYVQLGKIQSARNVRTAGVAQASLLCPFKITGQFAWPTDTTIEADKEAKAQAFLNFVGLRYGPTNAIWWDLNIDFTEQLSAQESLEPYYEVTIEATWEVISSL